MCCVLSVRTRANYQASVPAKPKLAGDSLNPSAGFGSDPFGSIPSPMDEEEEWTLEQVRL